MTLEFFIFLAAGAAAGGFINGLAGFGTSLFALGWWLQVMPPRQAVAVALIMSIASGIQGLIIVRRAIRWRRLAVFLLPALLGIPIGLRILEHIEAGPLKVLIAAFLLLYGGFFLLRRDLPALARPTPWIDGGIGFLSGILGALAGLSGALPTMWLALRDWTKEQSRAVLQPFNVTVLGIAAGLLALDGGYKGDTLISVAVALPITVLFAQVGLLIFKRLPDALFRRLLILLMFLSGLILLGRMLL